MNNRSLNIKKYKGFGLVESIIAIAITGIAAMFLMTVTSNSLKTLTKTELTDQLTTELVASRQVINRAVEEYNFNPEATSSFLDDVDGFSGGCYPISSDLVENVGGSDNYTLGIDYLTNPICGYSNSGLISTCLNPEVGGAEVLFVDEPAFQSFKKDDSGALSPTTANLYKMFCVSDNTTETFLSGRIYTYNFACVNAEADRSRFSSSPEFEIRRAEDDECQMRSLNVFFPLVEKDEL